MTAHSITWDHSECEHSDGDDHWCRPDARVTCSATGLGENYCRAMCFNADCGEFVVCDGDSGCDWCINDPTIDTPHDVHCGLAIIEAGKCNAVEFLTYDDAFSDVSTFVDGPINVRWTYDHYEWEYAS